MRQTIYSKSLMALALAGVSTLAFAAEQTTTVTGNLTNWKTWNASSKSGSPLVDPTYAEAAAGIDLVQGTTQGAAVVVAPNTPHLNIPVTGTITYDDVTGVISALTLTQVGSFNGYFDVPDSESGLYDGLADEEVTYSGLQWQLNTNDNFLSQVTGIATGCASSDPVCAFAVAGVNANGHLNDADHSVFDFQGIQASFKTQPRRNNADENLATAYGTVSYKVWSETPGVSGQVDVNTNAVTLTVASRNDSGTVTTNAANIAQFVLTLDGGGGGNGCTAGNYFDGNSCVAADPGSYVPSANATEQIPCAPGSYQPDSGQSACLPADIGSYVENSGATEQTSCPEGTTSFEAGATACEAIVTDPADCEDGYYLDGGQCVISPAGSYVPSVGATEPTPCAPGTYQPNEGQEECLEADPGYKVSTSGATSQTQCVAGTYQDEDGQTSCITAPKGYYVPAAGAITKIAASKNYYVATTGATGQTACPSGFTTAATASIAKSYCRKKVSFYSLGTYDGHVLESSETSSLGGTIDSASSTLRVGDDASDRQYRGILHFATGSTIEDNAVIVASSLTVRRFATVGSVTSLGSLVADIKTSCFGSSTCSLTTTDFQNTASLNSAATLSLVSGTTTLYRAAALSTTARGLISKTSYTQFRLRYTNGDNDDRGDDYLRFYSGNYTTTPAYKPVLTVEYYLP